jgi:tetratricopeptide (TPR) repeat protein
MIGAEYLKLANIGFNILLFLVGLKLAVLIHEIGHLLFAKFVGGTPRRLILGKGHKVAETRYSGVKIILNSKFNSGLAYAAFNDLKFIRIKLLFFTSGGFLTNFLIAALLFFLFDFSTSASERIQLSSAFGIANLLTGISVLIPRYSSYQGLRLYSDGLSILRIPFHKKSNLVELSSVNELLDAFDLLESKKYEEAIGIYENFQSRTEGSKAANINLSIAHMKLGNYERAAALMEELLPLIDEEPFKRHKHFIYNGLAWEYLLLERLEEADKYSELAYKIDPNTEHVRGTRASVLIEKGEFGEGKDLLINDVDFNFPNSQTLAAAIYVSLAFHRLDEHKKAEKYLQFVERNLNILDIDEKSLYDRAKEKMTIHNSSYE